MAYRSAAQHVLAAARNPHTLTTSRRMSLRHDLQGSKMASGAPIFRSRAALRGLLAATLGFVALVWPGISRGRTRSRQIASLLLPFYFAEAIVRAVTEPGRHALVAGSAAALSAAALVALLLSFRKTR